MVVRTDKDLLSFITCAIDSKTLIFGVDTFGSLCKQFEQYCEHFTGKILHDFRRPVSQCTNVEFRSLSVYKFRSSNVPEKWNEPWLSLKAWKTTVYDSGSVKLSWAV